MKYKYFDQLDHTIYSLATPPGPGAVAVLRISGKCVKIILDKYITGPSKIKPNYSYYAHIHNKKFKKIDNILFVYFKNPKSYTGEDVLELYTHSSPVIIDEIISTIKDPKNNIRQAYPGEFTFRAVINKKIDLIQAQSINSLIDSSSIVEKNNYLNILDGNFSEIINTIKNSIIKLKRDFETDIDFSDQDLENNTTYFKTISNISRKIADILNNYNKYNMLSGNIKIVITGKPNVGKSSFFNSIIEKNRAIVTSISGTTRDIISETILINGYKVTIYDTAGIRNATGVIEKIGVDKTLEQIKSSNIIIHILDGNKKLINNDIEIFNTINNNAAKNTNLIVLVNKNDLKQKFSIKDLKFLSKYISYKKDIISISSKTKTGINIVEQRIAEKLNKKLGKLNISKPLLTRIQADMFSNIYKELKIIKDLLKKSIPLEIIGIHIDNCIKNIGSMTGEITSEDILTEIFSNFCIGK